MIKTTQPALHGDQHCPDGSDPIPCLLTAPAAGGTYPEAVLAHPCLVHYWPADEPSGNLFDRKGSLNFAPITADVGGVTYPQHGAAGPFPELPDLTAVVNAGVTGSAPNHHNHFQAGSPDALPWAPETAGFSVEFWLYLTAYQAGGLTSTILDVGSSSSTNGVSVIMFSPAGKRLTCGYGGVSVTDPADLPLNTWHHVVVTYDASDVLRLYRNGSLLDTDTTGGSGWANTVNWLNTWAGPIWQPTNGRGAQLAIYDCALTADEIAGHYELRDIGASGAAGLVLTTDGEGGADWEFPTVKVDGTRYDEILSGTGLTSTDNTDGTVTIDATGGGAPTGAAGGVLDGTYPNPGLNATVAGAGLAETSDVLSVNVDASTIEINSDTLRVKAGGITANELASTTVTSGSYGDATHVAQFTVDADGRLTAAANVTLTTSTFDPATATTWWYPLIDSDGLAVLDDNGALIPTLIPF